jgi:hypothetical protein
VFGGIEVMLVEESVERGMGGFERRFRCRAEDIVALSELDCVLEHVEFGEWFDVCCSLPMCMNICNNTTPLVDHIPIPFVCMQ